METASARLAAPSFGRMCLTCDFTVPSPTERARLICALVSPRHRSLTTSISRGEFGQLQQRLGTVGIPALQAQTPVSYILFDLTHLDGETHHRPAVYPAPYPARRPWHQPRLPAGSAPPTRRGPGGPARVGQGPPHRRHCRSTPRLLLPARPIPCMAQTRLAQPHRSRRRRLTARQRQPNRPTRRLLLGQPTPSGADGQDREIEFIGAVGTGWTIPTARQLLQQLTELHTRASPFSRVLPREYARDARWVQPTFNPEQLNQLHILVIGKPTRHRAAGCRT